MTGCLPSNYLHTYYIFRRLPAVNNEYGIILITESRDSTMNQ